MAFPVIDKVPFSTVLIIDDQPSEVVSLKKDLQKKNILVICAKSSAQAESILELKPELSLVILDWLLDEKTDIEAKRLLQLMKKHAFAPVIVYTDQGANIPNQYISDSGLSRIAKAFNKSEVVGEKVFGEMEKWLTDNPELKIFLRWGHEVRSSLSKTMWTVYDLEVGGMRAIVELLKPPDGSSYTTREHDLVTFLGRVLTRILDNDESFGESIKAEVDKLQGNESVPIAIDKLSLFHAFERYKPSNSKTIWTGSILKHQAGHYFIVVTPACDLCNRSKIERIILIKAEPLEKYRQDRGLTSEAKVKDCIGNNVGAVHYLPYAARQSEGLVCRFDRIHTLSPKTLEKLLEEGKMTCIEVVDSPFVENLIQRMNAYLMRLGVRNLDEREITKLERDTR